MANIFKKIKGALRGSNNTSSQSAPAEEVMTGTPVTDFKIKGMNCMHCQAKALAALKSIDGVNDATVDLESTKAHIDGIATTTQIEKALEPTGFKAVFD